MFEYDDNDNSSIQSIQDNTQEQIILPKSKPKTVLKQKSKLKEPQPESESESESTHNSEKFLKQAIDSVFSQSFKDWEIIFLPRSV